MKNKIVVTTRRQVETLIRQAAPGVSPRREKEWRRKFPRTPYVGPGVVESRAEASKDVYALMGQARLTGVLSFPIPSLTKPVFITIRDLSAGGSEFLSPHALVEGQKVNVTLELENDDVEIPATVVHCTGTIGMFKVGVKFDLPDLP